MLINNFYSNDLITVGGCPIWISHISSKLIENIDEELKSHISILDETNGWQSPVFNGMHTTGHGYHRISKGGFESNFINDNKLNIFANILTEQVKLFLKFINSNALHNKFFITESWLTDTRMGEYARAHMHAPSDISGVYYVKASKDCGSIRLMSPTSYLMSSLPFKGCIQSSDYIINPKVGMLILFPSTLFHDVESNRSEDRRISISFNIEFPRY
jgi:uncharacterized protein (TIGR02466 family)